MKFKPEDFEQAIPANGDCTVQFAASVANRKLAEWLEPAPVVYGNAGGKPWPVFRQCHKGFLDPRDTHTARIVCIEEMPKEPCKHEPEPIQLNNALGNYIIHCSGVAKCRLCGVNIVATWKAKE